MMPSAPFRIIEEAITYVPLLVTLRSGRTVLSSSRGRVMMNVPQALRQWSERC